MIINNEVYAKQTKEHIKSQLEPYLNEWEEIKELKDNPELSKDFLITWIGNFVWAVKDSTK